VKQKPQLLMTLKRITERRKVRKEERRRREQQQEDKNNWRVIAICMQN
jgi:hypothetical protein